MSNSAPAGENPRGSIWNRWDPHIHTPGTILNDQYSGADPFDDFLKRIETSDPPLRALGITDYYSLDTYEKTVSAKKQGRLKDVELIFPNVELRFKLGTGKGSALNGHLIISPQTSDHLAQARRFLSKLIFSSGTEKYSCSKSDLEKLGRDHDKTLIDDTKALRVGTLQFKVDFDNLLGEIKHSDWARENIMIAVAVSSNGGTSGLAGDDSFAATRQAIERSSHFILSGNPGEREFWLGKKSLSKEDLQAKYNGLKPCIHGSDAHENNKVARPDQDRFTWIKGDVSFESLRQICIEPEDRVFVGPIPPHNPIESKTIDSVTVENAEWISPSQIKLNPGLITIIGARGSGKTALADLIAVAGYASSSQANNASFIRRAQAHLGNVKVSLNWLAGDNTSCDLGGSIESETYELPKIQYLSQQFVEQLCSSEGVTDELLLEIEKVIFSTHPSEARLGLTDFTELLDQRCLSSRNEQGEFKERLNNLSKEIGVELSKRNAVPALKKKLEDKAKEIATDTKSRHQLVSKGQTERLKLFQKISAAFDKVSSKLESSQNRIRAIETLIQNVSSARTNTFANYHSKLKDSNSAIGLTATEWKDFQVDFVGDVDKLLSFKLSEAKKDFEKIKGTKAREGTDVETSLIPDGKDLKDVTFELLNQELNRLKKLVGIDDENGKKFSRLTEKIVKLEKEAEKLRSEIKDFEGATDRISALRESRKTTYQSVFGAILNEETQLKELYKPLMQSLAGQQGSMGKLKFTVKRSVNAVSWSDQGEALLDLRKIGPFKGKGALLESVNNELKNVWEEGSQKEIADAVSNFRANHETAILEHSPFEKSDSVKYSNWANKIGDWLYSTDHISISYGLSYDGIDIQQLSPGTRGIVLLLLYLAIDKEDDRPLIIDQPEENLDPKSIFDELVPIFRQVKKRRQIVIITHNANLVVNADADQVIIASAGAHKPGRLPKMTYHSGGLEDQFVRKKVCEILEGGEVAFQERAKRLRVSIPQ
jgi:energy-coupling factor transporter ATP-binding protein EcfA2